MGSVCESVSLSVSLSVSVPVSLKQNGLENGDDRNNSPHLFQEKPEKDAASKSRL